MINLFPKKLFLSILFGLVFFLGGAGVVSAATDTTVWAYQHRINQGRIVATINYLKGEVGSDDYGAQPMHVSQGFLTQASCETDRVRMGTTGDETVSDSCSSYTVAQYYAESARGTAAVGAYAASISGPEELKDFTCNPFLGEIKGCFPISVFYLIYRPTMYLLIGSGYLFDKMLSLSIEGDLVAPSFVDSTWLVVRDFSNMLFIFILIYTGVQTILGFGDWRKTVLRVVIMALLINFSLFFTKVVIDAGNVLAVGIKNSISPGSSISAGLVGAFQPQMFLDTAGKVGPIDATIVFIVASIVSGFTAYILFKAAILFSRRLIVFWGLMILSPFAFISIALPGDANKFGKWTKELTNQTFVAPIFLFLIYVIAKVVSAGNILTSVGFSPSAGTSGTIGSWFTSLIGPIIIAALIVKALQESLNFAEDMAGKTGAEFSNLVTGAMGAAAVAPAMGLAATGGLIRGAGVATSWSANKLGMGGGKLDNFGKSTQSAGRVVGTASSIVDPYKLPKNLAKIPVVGGVAGGAAKAVVGALGVPDVREMFTGGDKGKEAAKAKKKTEENEATVTKFMDELHKDARGNDLVGPTGALLKTTHPIKPGQKLDEKEVKDAIEAKRDALQFVVANAEATLKNTPSIPQDPYVAAVVAKDKAKRDLAEFTQSASKAKELNKELKDNS